MRQVAIVYQGEGLALEPDEARYSHILDSTASWIKIIRGGQWELQETRTDYFVEGRPVPAEKCVSLLWSREIFEYKNVDASEVPTEVWGPEV